MIKYEFFSKHIKVNIFPQIIRRQEYIEIFCKMESNKKISSIKLFAAGLCEDVYSKEDICRITGYTEYDMKELYNKSDAFFVRIDWKYLDIKLYLEYNICGEKIQTEVFEINYLAFDTSKEAWNDSIYFIMVDRFANNKNECKFDNDDYFCGGKFANITQQVEKIKSNGYSIIYLSPVMSSLSYHGYDQTSLNIINNKFGGEGEFRDLIDTILDNDMKPGIEIVLNHLSVFSDFFKEGLKRQNDLFYIDDKYEYVKYRDCFNLAKLKYTYDNTMNIVNIVISILKTYHIRFVRLDCCDYLEPILVNLISKWTDENNVILTGECWNNYNNFFNHYSIDGATNYWLYGKVKEMFIEKKLSSKDFQNELINNILDNGFERAGSMLNFIDNHDVERISTVAENEGEIKKMLSFIFLYIGIPVVYYGTENYNSHICTIKANRRPYFTQEINEGIEDHIRYLNAIRKEFVDNIVYFDSTDKFFVFSRNTKKGYVSFIYNNSDSEGFFKTHYVKSFDYFILEERRE